MRYMLDTNTCIAASRGKTDPALKAKIFAHLAANAGEVCISTLTQYELQFGVERAAQSYRQQNLTAIAQLTALITILDFGQDAALVAARVRQELNPTGKAQLGIGPIDTLIAGHALSLGLILVTNNVREFSRVAGLQVEDWMA